jgi:DNA polymerase III delta prime subunit
MKKIENAIRTSFYRKRDLKIEEEIVPKEASLLLAGKLKQVTDHSLMYPSKEDQIIILDFDQEGTDAFKEKNDIEKLRQNLLAQGLSQSKVDRQVPRPPEYSMAVLSKERTFHYIPYDFKQSGFEKSILEEALIFTDLNNVEIYYNGEKYLTEFRIDCMEKQKNGRWKKIGMYTPDFLLLKRNQTQIHKVLIVETKGSGFAEQSQFIGRLNFVENEFLKINNEKFGYSRFDYLYLSDADKQENNLNKLVNKAREFFKD